MMMRRIQLFQTKNDLSSSRRSLSVFFAQLQLPEMKILSSSYPKISIQPINYHNFNNYCTTIVSSSSSSTSPPNNTLEITGTVINRNPRNLEKLRLATKAQGWNMEKSGKCFWNKLVVEVSSKYITAKIQHFHGQVPVVVSTKEWSINKFLYSGRDTSAAIAVGQVLGRRCLESGILELYCNFTEEERKKEKISAILKGLTDAGISLTEPDHIFIPHNLNYPTLPEKSWDIHEEIELQPVEKSKKS